jgi:DUF971 family protein
MKALWCSKKSFATYKRVSSPQSEVEGRGEEKKVEQVHDANVQEKNRV